MIAAAASRTAEEEGSRAYPVARAVTALLGSPTMLVNPEPLVAMDSVPLVATRPFASKKPLVLVDSAWRVPAGILQSQNL